MKIPLSLLISQIICNAYVRGQSIISDTGAPVGVITNSLASGAIGPVLLQDTTLIDTLSRFDRERIPPRALSARGTGAYGYFEATADVSRYTRARVFEVGTVTPVFVRFSITVAEAGAAETTRSARGFATKFYTEEGNWDLVANNLPIFFIRDAILMPSLMHVVRRDPVTNLRDRNAFWDLISLRPETIRGLTQLYTDLGIPDGYRYMNAYGINTFKLVNAAREQFYCRFNLLSDQGIRNLTVERAAELSIEDPDYATRDLYTAIQEENYPSWTLYIQVMTPAQAETLYFNPFDATKEWPENEFPNIRVGRLVINRLPGNFFAEVEQSAFSPANLIPGIELSPDKLLQGRVFAYGDAQRYRVGANFNQIPVNFPYRSPPNNYNRDGAQTVTNNQGGQVNYYPNSYGGPVENLLFVETSYPTSGMIARFNTSNEDNFFQTEIFYRTVLTEDQRERLADTIAQDLCLAEDFIQERALRNFYLAYWNYGLRVERALQRIRENDSCGA